MQGDIDRDKFILKCKDRYTYRGAETQIYICTTHSPNTYIHSNTNMQKCKHNHKNREITHMETYRYMH